MNKTEAFGAGYTAGYNQALVDKGFMTQEEADKILTLCYPRAKGGPSP